MEITDGHGILDLSLQNLKKINKPDTTDLTIHTLILDNNEFTRLENIDNFLGLTCLSASKNQITRMFSLYRLITLQVLNLSDNSIVNIEGLKELTCLKSLNLSGNNIKTIEHLHNNINLEHIDLSRNQILSVADLSHLKKLNILHLHHNKINHLKYCDRYLPNNIGTLTLAGNELCDLNEISQIAHLVDLCNISLEDNPCVNRPLSPLVLIGNCSAGFDYRPYLINWFMGLKVIDDYAVDAIESLRGEWLYSQGRGRNFRIGEHNDLVQYLSSVCPPNNTRAIENEEGRKLRLILSKAQHHQQQLRNTSHNPMTQSTGSINCAQTQKFVNRVTSTEFTQATNVSIVYAATNSTGNIHSEFRKSFDSAAAAYSDLTPSRIPALPSHTRLDSPAAMTRSLDSSTLNLTLSRSDFRTNGKMVLCNELRSSDNVTKLTHSGKLQALSKLLPVPESLMSPDCAPLHALLGSSSDTESIVPDVFRSSQLNKKSHRGDAQDIRYQQQNHLTPLTGTNKLFAIEQIANEKRCQEQAATYIQKFWRGFHVRNRNLRVSKFFQILQQQRENQLRSLPTTDLQSRVNAEKKTSQDETGGTAASSDILIRTCETMRADIERLETSMKDMMRILSTFVANASAQTSNSIAVQTDAIMPNFDNHVQRESCSGDQILLNPRPQSLQFSGDNGYRNNMDNVSVFTSGIILSATK